MVAQSGTSYLLTRRSVAFGASGVGGRFGSPIRYDTRSLDEEGASTKDIGSTKAIEGMADLRLKGDAWLIAHHETCCRFSGAAKLPQEADGLPELPR